MVTEANDFVQDKDSDIFTSDGGYSAMTPSAFSQAGGKYNNGDIFVPDFEGQTLYENGNTQFSINKDESSVYL